MRQFVIMKTYFWLSSWQPTDPLTTLTTSGDNLGFQGWFNLDNVLGDNQKVVIVTIHLTTVRQPCILCVWLGYYLNFIWIGMNSLCANKVTKKLLGIWCISTMAGCRRLENIETSLIPPLWCMPMNLSWLSKWIHWVAWIIHEPLEDVSNLSESKAFLTCRVEMSDVFIGTGSWETRSNHLVETHSQNVLLIEHVIFINYSSSIPSSFISWVEKPLVQRSEAQYGPIGSKLSISEVLLHIVITQ